MCVSGLSKMHELTADKARPVRFRAWLWNDTEYQFQFQSFRVENKSTNYTLRLGDYNSSASSSAPYNCESGFLYNKDQKFSTVDRDNDIDPKNCAQTFSGAGWWYNRCTGVSPNVKYCPAVTCGLNFENIKVGCLMGPSYSMKKFQIDLFIDEI